MKTLQANYSLSSDQYRKDKNSVQPVTPQFNAMSAAGAGAGAAPTTGNTNAAAASSLPSAGKK